MNDPLAKYRSGSTEPWTAALICALVAAKQPEVLLETGTYLGLTTAEMIRVLPAGAVLHTIDNFDSAGVIPDDVLNHPQVQFHKADAIQWITDYDGPFIDFAFVDDDHLAPHVDEELEILLPKMSDHGLICVHDVIGHFGLSNVVRKYHGYVLDMPLMHLAGGLGLIQL